MTNLFFYKDIHKIYNESDFNKLYLLLQSKIIFCRFLLLHKISLNKNS